MHFIYTKIDTHIVQCGFPEILSREFQQTLPFLFCTAFSKHKKVLHLTLFVNVILECILWLFLYIFEAIHTISTMQKSLFSTIQDHKSIMYSINKILRAPVQVFGRYLYQEAFTIYYIHKVEVHFLHKADLQFLLVLEKPHLRNKCRGYIEKDKEKTQGQETNGKRRL